MWLPLKITREDGKEIIINEDMVVSVQSIDGGDLALIRMADGEVLTVSSPSYSEWENDWIKRSDN